MAPRQPTGLNLEAPEREEDIGLLSPYLALPSATSSQASSSTSTFSTSSPRLILTDGEFEDEIPIGNAMASSDVLNTPTNTRFMHQLPSSSPALARFPDRPAQLSRSSTLPDGFQHSKKDDSQAHKIREELKALSEEPSSIAKMRRWIMGIAVGKRMSWGQMFYCG
jgi:hypothetical protein